MQSEREEREAILGDQQGRAGHPRVQQEGGLVCPQSKGRLLPEPLVVASTHTPEKSLWKFCALG